MAASETERPDDEEGPTAPAASDDVDRGWSNAPKASDAKTVEKGEAPPEVEAGPAVEASVAVEGPPAAEASAVDEAPPAAEASGAVEGPPAAEASVAVEGPPAAEASAADEAPPVAEPRVAVERPPAAEGRRVVESPPAAEVRSGIAAASAAEGPVPPAAFAAATLEHGSAPAIAESALEPTGVVAPWQARPTKAWFVITLVGMVLALVVGIVIGRGMRSGDEPARASSAGPARAPTPPSETPPVSAPAESASAQTAPPTKLGTTVKQTLPAFNAQTAKLAIDRLAPRMKECKQPGEPPGSATVTVTFAPSGRVSDASVTTTRYAGTRTGNCIVARLRAARIAEFTGKPVTVKRRIPVR